MQDLAPEMAELVYGYRKEHATAVHELLYATLRLLEAQQARGHVSLPLCMVFALPLTDAFSSNLFLFISAL